MAAVGCSATVMAAASCRESPIDVPQTRMIIGSPTETNSKGRPTQMPKLCIREGLSELSSIALQMNLPGKTEASGVSCSIMSDQGEVRNDSSKC